MLKLLHHAEPAEKAALHANFGIKLTHKAPEKLVLVEADLAACRANGRVGEGTWPESLPEVEDEFVL